MFTEKLRISYITYFVPSDHKFNYLIISVHTSAILIGVIQNSQIVKRSVETQLHATNKNQKTKANRVTSKMTDLDLLKI